MQFPGKNFTVLLKHRPVVDKNSIGFFDLQLSGHNGGAIFVDYAHSPDALRNALQSLRPYARGKLVVVFGEHDH